MKSFIPNFKFTEILLIISVIASCVIKSPVAISVSIISLVINSLVEKHLAIKLDKQSHDIEFESIKKSISDIEIKVNHLTSKDTVKDMMAGLAPKR